MTTVIKLAFVGAGQVNFGGGEGPWNHVKRLEKIVGNEYPIRVVGICDPNLQQAQKVLQLRRESASTSILKDMWEETKTFSNLTEMLDSTTPHAVFIGVPPAYHGCTISPYDIEVQCARRGVHMFIEKPLSCHAVSEVETVAAEMKRAIDNGLIVSVGYMFRYSAAVKKMKELIQQYGEIKAFNARYNCAYSCIDKPVWWDVERSGGPIVEQATHFCDLARFLGGDVDLSTLQATSIKQTEKAGKLKNMAPNIDEEKTPVEYRVPRVTSAIWRFENGAIGTLMHGLLLHEMKYETELEVWGDGYRMVLIEPYGACKLSVRLPFSEQTTIYEFENDDPYLTEDLEFIRAVQFAASQKQNNQSVQNPFADKIMSPYFDSVGTYKLTWEIRTKSQQETSCANKK